MPNGKSDPLWYWRQSHTPWVPDGDELEALRKAIRIPEGYEVTSVSEVNVPLEKAASFVAGLVLGLIINRLRRRPRY